MQLFYSADSRPIVRLRVRGPPRRNYQPTRPGSLKASLMRDTSGSGQLP